ncbi:hypothetical protein V8E55_005340 [Tylopilus felleus]
MAALDSTYGALLIGVVVAALLHGCTCIQTWNYYIKNPSDWWYTKAFVACVLVTETCHQAMITHAIYTYIVTDFGAFEELDNIVFMVIAVFLNGFTTLFVQCFLAMRVYRLSKSWLAYGLVMIMVIAQFLLVLIYDIKALRYETFARLAALKALSMAINATSAVGDILITMFLCALLHRSRTGFQKSDTMINKLIMFSMNTGLLTSICALASLICISVWPHTFIYMAFYFNIGRLYCNSLLATLNARRDVRTESQCIADLSFGDVGMHRTSNPGCTKLKTSRAASNAISIQVDTIQEFTRDEVRLPPPCCCRAQTDSDALC